jgi:Flp pilus assembly pilin Flp
MRDFIADFLTSAGVRTADEAGQTMTEYGILIVFIALAVAAGAQLLGGNVLGLFTSVGGAV